jgi:long-chain-acyl-CoA dehydrogenase
VDRCLQLHGGYGYINEYEIARLWRDARVQRLYGGTTEIMKEIVGRSLGFLVTSRRRNNAIRHRPLPGLVR